LLVKNIAMSINCFEFYGVSKWVAYTNHIPANTRIHYKYNQVNSEMQFVKKKDFHRLKRLCSETKCANTDFGFKEPIP